MSSAVSSCARKPRDQLRINSSASLLPTIDSMLAGTFATSACSWQISVSVTDMQNSLPQGQAAHHDRPPRLRQLCWPEEPSASSSDEWRRYGLVLALRSRSR